MTTMKSSDDKDRRCAKCGKPENNHNYRHPFVSSGPAPESFMSKATGGAFKFLDDEPDLYGDDPMSAAAQVHNHAATIIGDLKEQLANMEYSMQVQKLGREEMEDLAGDLKAQLEAAKASSRWVLLKAVSNSGCSLFSCTICGRVSKSPDKRCAEVEKDCFGKVFQCEDQ